MDKKMDSRTSLYVRAFHWTERDVEYGPFTISAWCLDKESRPVHVKIHDFPAMCRLELPDVVNDQPIQWNLPMIEQLVRWLKNELREHEPFHYTVEYRYKLQYYNEVKYPIPQLFFCRLASLKKCVEYLRYPKYFPPLGKIQIETLDANVKTYRKLLTHLKMKHCQWFKIDANKVPQDQAFSTNDEYVVPYNKIEPIEREISDAWHVHPGILAFDIEAYSPNHRAMPKMWIIEHVAFMISVIYEKIGESESRQSFCITFLESRPIEGVTILKTNNEVETLEVFAKLINHLNPDIITGYNIMDFDWPYLTTRLELRNLTWLPFGRWKGKVPKLISRNKKYMRVSGRVNIDLLHFVKKTAQLRKYDLNTVGNHFLKRGKTGMTARRMFEIYEMCQQAYNKPELREEALDNATKVAEYAVRDSELVMDLFIKLNVWLSLSELSNVVGVNIKDLYLRGQQVRCFSQLWDLAVKSDILVNFRDVIRYPYDGATVLEPETGLHDPVHCFDFASMYPSIIIAMNICFTTLLNPSWVQHPSTQEFLKSSCNYVHSKDDYTDFTIADEDKEKNKHGGPVVQADGFYFVNTSVRRGILPELVHNLVTERNSIKKLLKVEKDQLKRELLDARQWGLKISANAFYGVLGTRKVYKGSLSLLEGAISITAKGRQCIMEMKQYLAKKYNARIIYGDTDSCMVDLLIRDPVAAMAIGPKIAEELTAIFPPPMRLEFEKMMRGIFIKAKTYSAYIYDKDGKVQKEGSSFLNRGGATVRREIFGWMAQRFEWVTRAALDGIPFYEVFDVIVDNCFEFLCGNISTEELVIVNEVRRISSDKSNNYFIYVFAQELQRQGFNVNPGDRVEYVIVKTNNKKDPMGKKMRLLEHYNEKPEPIDYLYYLNNRTQTRMDELYYKAYRPQIEPLRPLGYKSRSGHFYSVVMPIKMICAMARDGIDPRFAKLILRQPIIDESVTSHPDANGMTSHPIVNQVM